MTRELANARPSRHALPWMIASALAIAGCSGQGGRVGTDQRALGAAEETPRNNVILIVSDDERLSEMDLLGRARELVGGEHGTTFPNFIISTALCCPSRATMLTGQYGRNSGVIANVPPHGGYVMLQAETALPVWLQEAGYYTGHIGKYLNGYGRIWEDLGTTGLEVPPGWDDWQGLADPWAYRYTEFMLNDNGVPVPYFAGEYQTDVLADRAKAFIWERAGATEPFFLEIMPAAPHTEFQAPWQWRNQNDAQSNLDLNSVGHPRAPDRYQGAFADEPLPRPPSFNEEDLSDKPSHIRALPPLSNDADDPVGIPEITALYRARLRSLLAVYDLIEGVIETLESTGQLHNTNIIFTSDNGFYLGEHRLPKNKKDFYEPSIHLRLFARGPDFPAGEIRPELIGNVDIAATIADIAGATPLVPQDGQSILDVVRHPGLQRDRAIIIEQRGPIAQGVRTNRYTYVEYNNGERELYDLQEDPHQIESRCYQNAEGENVCDVRYAPIQSKLSALIAGMHDCGGDNAGENPCLRINFDE